MFSLKRGGKQKCEYSHDKKRMRLLTNRNNTGKKRMRFLINRNNINKKWKHGDSNKQTSIGESGSSGSDSEPFEQKERVRGII
jgi:hypothetical protein